MRHIHCYVFILLCVFSCQKSSVPVGNRLEKKSEPYDQFAFQRSFPDRDFDWKGWKKAINTAREAEWSVQERNGAGCVGNTTNWTLQGPANIGGRVNTLAVKPDDEYTVLAGFSAGGIFKSTDGGINWKPVFDEHIELSIGHIVFDPTNPNVVYAGTGDPNIPSIVFNGDGVFKSTDAGDTWQYLGLEQQGIVSKIQIDPTNPKIIYVATMGNPFMRDNERGIYKTTDGGLTWQQVLFVSNQAGASDLVINPNNPQILYASFWDRIRNNQESVIYGPHARVYKTTDGGATWTHLGGGLPTGIMGRTGLAMSAQNPDKLYVVYIDSLSTPGGLYKTTNGGTSWTSINIDALEDKCADFGWYFGKIDLHPNDDEEIYFHAIIMWRKAANSSAWMTAAGGHADSHDLAFTPSGRRYWANDGGVYRKELNLPYWIRCNNLPTTQFYHTNYNPHTPNVYWGGAQDNGINKGNGTAINNWASVYPADGFRSVFHPSDPNTYWVEIQNGSINKTTDGGATWQTGKTCLGTGDRCNWDTPYFMSAHNPDIQYAATYRVYASSNGNIWSPISGDLTDGIIYGPRFHTISALNESPLLSQKLYAGTSDGNVWRREPNTGWVNITDGLPDRYVTSVHGSTTLPNRIFVSHSGFRDNDYIPHVHRSDDNGQSWKDISGNLPQIPVNDLLILPQHADSILFAATDAGVYFTLNGGGSWGRLGGNIPFVPVFDLEHNPVRKELVAATYARGIWTFPLDSVFLQTPAALVNVGGAIQTEAGEGVAFTDVSGQTTNASGIFGLANVPGCQTYTLAPYRDDTPLNGVSTFDLVLISKHILGLEPLNSPYKIIAADANKSNSVTTFDIVTLRKLILGIDTVISNNTSWRFVPKSFLFPNQANPFQTHFPENLEVFVQDASVNGLDFTAIKVGDVNGSVIANLSGAAEERIAGEWPVYYQAIDFDKDKIAVAELSGAVDELAGIQFTLCFDTDKLDFLKVEPLLPGLTSENFGTHRVANGILTVCFENMSAIKKPLHTSQAPKPLFRVVFKAKSDGAMHRSLQLGESPTRSIAFQPDGTSLKPVLEMQVAPTLQSPSVRVWPNPFGATGVWLETKGMEAEATLSVFDQERRLVLQRAVAGAERIFVAADVFSAAGTYFYEITGEKTIKGKLVYTP
ncbi:MAG: hypothetical protein KF734_03940 [Saprospiraceae bacterium]|nr:hypothetical protein [Saprospiraceae bacterium]